MYRLRWSLTFPELVIAFREMLRHNEGHILSNDWLLMDPSGSPVPMITPEMRENEPEKAQMAEELLRLSVKDIDFSPEDFTK